MEGHVVYNTDELIGMNKRGRLKYWQGFAIFKDGNYYTYTTTGEELASGEIGNKKRSELTLVKGKNIGRANETTDEQQAIFNIESDARKLKDVAYCPIKGVPDVPMLPMLAENFKDRQNTIVFPCALQPKYNGNRACKDDDYYKFRWWTRKGKGYKPEITAHMDFLSPFATDGEFMLPFPKYKLADIASVCKKFYGRECDPSTLDLSYHIFDLIDTSLPFRLRHEKLTKWYEKALKNGDVPGSVMLVPTYNCESLENVDKYFRRAIRVGYEGIMLRNWDSPYLLGWYDLRSTDLMKLKPCEDGEYEIAGCLEGNGKETGCIMFTCKTKEGLTFDVHPEGSLLGRRQQYSDFLSGKFDPIGKMYTIRYQELSKDKIPIHAVGVAVRDYE